MDRSLPEAAEAALREFESMKGLVSSLKEEFDFELERVTKALRQGEREIADKAKALEVERARLGNEVGDLERRRDADRKIREAEWAKFQAFIHDKMMAFDFVGRAWADYELARGELKALYLEEKSYPAPTAAAHVRFKSQELAEMRRRLKVTQWTNALYESYFPWLVELRDIDEEEDYVAGLEQETPGDGQPEDPVKHWLTAEEFRKLPSAERNQRALDRYLASRKSNWQIGRDYERYVGYLREQAGCHVTYHGIFKGLEDLGRDLLAERNTHIEVIQCKRWSSQKVIHEKHVFQLFGTVVAMRIENPDKEISGTFTTSTSLSDRAREFAKHLDIRVEEGFPLADYPRIKCNVPRVGGERIYHLPFDQQYDTTLIEPERGERYASTVADAEARGFRRAWRWREPGKAATRQ